MRCNILICLIACTIVMGQRSSSQSAERGKQPICPIEDLDTAPSAAVQPSNSADLVVKELAGFTKSLASLSPGPVHIHGSTPTLQSVRAAWSSLLVYARLGMLAKGKLLVEPRLRDETPAALLMCAAIAGDLPAVRKLLSEGAVLVDATNDAGETALMHAAVGGSLETLHALLDSGADVDAQDLQGWTALMKVRAREGGKGEEGREIERRTGDAAGRQRSGEEARGARMGGRGGESASLPQRAGAKQERRV
jgi:hypothetical protein